MENSTQQDLNKTNLSTGIQQKHKRLSSECRICGGSALYSHFGVITCDSCRIFFRRNANKKQNACKCHYNNDCEITIHNRHICAYCRLDKCLKSGMSTDMIRAPRTARINTNQKEKQMTRSTTESIQNKQYQSVEIQTLNLLPLDQSILTTEQWNLISNLTHCFDEYSAFSLAQTFLQQQNQLPVKLRFKLEPIARFYLSFFNGARLFYEENRDFESLCSHDRSILLHHTMKYVSGLNAWLVLRYTRLLDNIAFRRSAEILCGSDTIAIANRAIGQLDSDSKFIKLILALLAFSAFSYTDNTNMTRVNLRNIKSVLDIQDRYTELIWRYLVYKYGHEQSVIRFSNLIRSLFLLNDAIVGAVQHKEYTYMIHVFIKQTEMALTSKN